MPIIGAINIIYITPSGLARWESARGKVLAAITGLLVGIDVSDLSALARGLGSLLERLRERAAGDGERVD